MLKGVGDPFADWRDVTYVGSLEDENGTGGTMSGIQVPPPLMPSQLTRSLTSVTDGKCSRMHALTYERWYNGFACHMSHPSMARR